MCLRTLYKLGPDIDFSLPPACPRPPTFLLPFSLALFTSLHAICLVDCVPSIECELQEGVSLLWALLLP